MTQGKISRLAVGTAFVATTLVITASPVAHAEQCNPDSATLLPVSSSGRPIEIFGYQIGHPSILELWEIVTKSKAHAPLGKVIAAGHDWFGSCAYPGIGIVAGTGRTLDSRYVALWIWSDEVNLAQARQSVVEYLNELVVAKTPPSTTSTTSSTSTTSTTLPPASADVSQDETAIQREEINPAKALTATNGGVPSLLPVAASLLSITATAPPSISKRRSVRRGKKKNIRKRLKRAKRINQQKRLQLRSR